jgi:Bacterial membrane protein YfhO
METAIRAAPPPAAAPPVERRSRIEALGAAVAGPALIVACVLISLRGFAFLPNLTNQHPDILSFWLPRSCLLGSALADGRVPLWNPFEMAGTPFAADAQSGWLYLPSMLLSAVFGCGDGLRAFIVLNPILAGLGLWWFLRKEGLGRIAATVGGLSLAMAAAASIIAISLPFAGFLAWTPFALVGASGFYSFRGWMRFTWMALAALAWSQVAAAHLSHGLAMGTALVVAYVAGRAIHEVRAGTLAARTAALFAMGFLAFLPLASLAILLPRFALLERSSLRAGYEALQGTVARASVMDRPIPDHGIWSAWPLALASTPGAYLGAATLLAIPFAFRDRRRRFLVATFAVVGVLGYLLTITLVVGAGWFRALVLRIPLGDVLLHNPGRLRFVAFLVVPVLGAVGVQSLLERRPSFGEALRWLAVPAGVFLLWPLVAGANAGRLVIFAIGTAAVLVVVYGLGRGRRWAPAALAGVLAVELLAGAMWSSAYRGGTVYFGLESAEHPVLVHGPLRWPRVDLDRYLAPGPIASTIAERDDDRYLAWVPPAAYFNKGYLFTQTETDWPALLLGRAIPFGLHDVLGYSPIQVPRYWSYIRATNRLPVFYNAAVIQIPSVEDVRLLGVRYLIAHEGQPLPPAIGGEVAASERGYRLYELEAAEPRVSVTSGWTVVDGGAEALEAVLTEGFDPSATAVLEADPGIEPTVPDAPGNATYTEVRPEDVRIAVRANAPSLVVIRNTWEPGWVASVDGHPAPVLRADYLMQAVPVAAGDHQIRLVYREPAIGLGIALSAVAWALLALAAFATATIARRRRATLAATPGSSPPPGA